LLGDKVKEGSVWCWKPPMRLHLPPQRLPWLLQHPWPQLLLLHRGAAPVPPRLQHPPPWT
jgi:hypothetical protein